MNLVQRTLSQIWSLLVGLGITGKYIFKRDVTVYYPRQTVAKEDMVTFRGPIELIGLDADPATPRCISCMLCAQACPSNCITVTKSPAPKPTEEEKQAMAEAEARGEKVKKPSAPKYPAGWTYNFTLCSLCGSCVESCPVDSIRFSNNIYLAGTSRQDFHFDLLARLRRLALKNASTGAEQVQAQPSQPAVTPAMPIEPAGQAKQAGPIGGDA